MPQTREDVFPFFKELWILNSKFTYEECLMVADELNELYKGDQEIEGCIALFMMSSAYIRNKRNELTIHSNKAIELLQATQNKEGEGAWHIIMGSSYRVLGNNDSALNYIEKGIKQIPEKSYYSRFLVMGYYQGGEIFFLFNKLDESLDYFNKALNLPEIDILLKSRVLNGIGNVLLKQKKFDEASKLLHQSYELVKGNGVKLLHARLLSDLGNFYFETKDFNTALEYQSKSYELRKELNLTDPQVTNLLHFYKIYKATGLYDKAFEALKEAYTLAKDNNLKGKLSEIYQKRVEYFEDRKEYKEALTELKQYVSSHENEMNASFDLRIGGIKAVHELEFARQEAESTREMNKVLSDANEKINAKNQELKLTLDELTRTKISRKSVVVTMMIGISLCLLTEILVDPLIDNYSYNIYISLAVKVIIAIMLKPIDSMYEQFLIKKALKP